MTGRRQDIDRALSPVVGYVLLVGIVAVGSIGFLVVANGAFDQSEGKISDTKVEQGYLKLAGSLDGVSLSGDSVRKVNLALPDEAGQAVRTDNAGWIRVVRDDINTGNQAEVYNESIGAIRFRNEDTGTVFGYQNGAVFKNSNNGTSLVSSPQLAYSLNSSDGSPTLTLPIIKLTGAEKLSGGEVVMRKVETKPNIFNESVIRGELVRVTIKSEWYVGWAAYFRNLAAKTGTAETAVSVDHANQTATLTLFAPETRTSLKGIVSGSTSGFVTIENQVAIKSYNSSVGPYGSGATRDDGDLFVAGNLTLKQKAQVNGSVFVGDTLRFESSNPPTCDSGGKYVICENASFGTIDNDNTGTNFDEFDELVKENNNSPADVPSYQSVDNIIDAKVNDLQSNNDNGEVSAINGNSLGGCTDPCRLDEGQYYLSEIKANDLKGKTLILNTSDGPIDIAIAGEANFDDSVLNVTGGNRVDIYVKSNSPGTCTPSGGGGCDFVWDKADMRVRGPNNTITDRAANFWVFMKSDADATWITAGGGGGSPPEFTGVLFGPGNGTTPGVNVTIGEKNYIQGTIVGNISFVGQKVQLRYDRALRRSTIIAKDIKVPKVTYLLGTEYVVEIDDEQ